MSKTAPINMRVEPGQRALLTKAAVLKREAIYLDVACREGKMYCLIKSISTY